MEDEYQRKRRVSDPLGNQASRIEAYRRATGGAGAAASSPASGVLSLVGSWEVDGVLTTVEAWETETASSAR